MDKLVNYSLSDSEMKRIIPGTKFTPYNKLAKMTDINQLFGKNGTAIIMYLTSRNYGHWCCIFKKLNGELSYFNSYGTEPDYEMTSRLIKPDVRLEHGEVLPHLYELICKSGKKCEFNDYKLQDQNVATCGRHVALRLWNRHLDADEYAKRLINLARVNNLNTDEIVTLLTQPRLKNN